MSITIGSIIDGKYRVVRQIGKGGMGAVFAAEHLRIKRQVAIKVLHAEVAGSAELAQRFEREAQAAAQIGSQHIVEVLDCGVADDGERFMVMEFLDGETLRQRLKRGGRMSPEQAAPVFMQLLEGLSAAHAAGIIHRDLKPDNIYLERERAGQRDWVKILDFGISKFSEIGGEEQMTRTGAVMGTLFFMSPEQARSANLVDARSDLYSVGAMLFQALTGDVPFRATTLAEMLFKIVFDPLPHPRERAPELQDDICAIILKAIARDPAERFQSALEFREALAPIAQRGGVNLPNPAPLGAVPPVPPAIAFSEAKSPSSSAASPARAPAPVSQPEAFEMSSNLATSASMAVASGASNTLSGERSVATDSGLPRPRSKAVPIAIAAVAGVVILGGIAVLALGSSSTSSSSSARETSLATRASATLSATASSAPATPSEPATTTSAAVAPSSSAAPSATTATTVAAGEPVKTTSKPASTAPATPAGKPASKPAGKPGGFDPGY